MCRTLLRQDANRRHISFENRKAAADRWVVSDFDFGIEDGSELEDESLFEAVLGLRSKVESVNSTYMDEVFLELEIGYRRN